MSSIGYNRIVGAQLEVARIMWEELEKAGWNKGWRKKNNLTYYIKIFPGDVVVTATTLEDALKWEYEL
jgi:hypothetical protein